RMGSASPTRPRTRGSPPDAVYTPLDLTSITATAIAVVHTEVVVFPTAVAVMRTKVAVMPGPVAAAQSQVVVMHQATAVTQISVAVMHRQATGIANPVAARSIPVGVTPAEVSGARTAFPYFQRKILSATRNETTPQPATMPSWGAIWARPWPSLMMPRRAWLIAVSGRALTSGWRASGKRSEEKKVPERSHMGSMM